MAENDKLQGKPDQATGSFSQSDNTLGKDQATTDKTGQVDATVQSGDQAGKDNMKK